MLSNRRKFRNGNEEIECRCYPTEPQRARYTKGIWTCENEPYRFPMDESSKDPWEQCFEVVDKADEERYKELQTEISDLLVVASLFLAVVTSFTVMSFEWLRADDSHETVVRLGDTVKLLIDVVKLLNDTDARGTVPPRDTTSLDFDPDDNDVIINQLWFLSMTLSLSAVVVGTFCLQWLSTFQRKELKRKSYDDALALRQLRFEGLMGWGVPHVPGFLLLTVQGAFVLFTIGLMYLLWSVNNRVAVPVVITGGVVALLLAIAAIMPLLQSVLGRIIPSTLHIPQCPYKSPLSWVFHRGCVLLSIIVTLPFYRLPGFEKLRDWHKQQVELLTDYTWQIFDNVWRDQRENVWRDKREGKGPQTSKTESTYSHYCVHGLASAMEMLLFKPNAVHVVHQCLQDLYGTTATAAEEVIQGLFAKKDSKVDRALKDYQQIPSLPGTFNSHIRNLKNDFLSAVTFQSFVSQYEKLHRTLLPHRVELYVRIKNSFHHFKLTSQATSDAESKYESTSIECPIRTTRDAETLSPELLDQLLRFSDWYLDGHRCEATEVAAIEFVLRAIERLQTIYGTKATDTDEPRSVDMDGSGSGSKSHNEPVTADSPVDKGLSAELMDLYKVVLEKFEKYKQRAKEEEDTKDQQESKEEKSWLSSIVPHNHSKYRSQYVA